MEQAGYHANSQLVPTLRNTKDIDSEICRAFPYSSLSKHPVGSATLIVSLYSLMFALWI